MKRSNIMMIIPRAFFCSATLLVLLFSMVGISYQQQNPPSPILDDEEGVVTSTTESDCIEYEAEENTIAIYCDASFRDMVRAIDDNDVLEELGEDEQEGQYLLKSTLRINNLVTFSMTADEDHLQYLKIVGDNGIIVHGTIVIDGIKITSWDESTNDIVGQDSNGTISRAYIQFDASEGSQIINSEFGYLGYQELGKRGFDLFGQGSPRFGHGPSRDMVIRNSEFHHMWRAFYSTGAYNITIDGNEYRHNLNYAVDPHSGTHNMTVKNNWLHHNPIGIICSVNCHNIVIEDNKIENNVRAGIFFSRNMYDSIARNNIIHNTSNGIIVSESPNNQIYNNTIEAATSGILLFNPAIPDDGFTAGNDVHNNTISNSATGINMTRSHDNILSENKFFNIALSEYYLTRNSSVTIIDPNFDNVLIAEDGPMTGNLVQILNSGTIEVIEINDQGTSEKQYYDTDHEPYRKVLIDGNSIIVNSLVNS
jgi:mannuronan 5-epimerase